MGRLPVCQFCIRARSVHVIRAGSVQVVRAGSVYVFLAGSAAAAEHGGACARCYGSQNQSKKNTPDARNVVTIIAAATRMAMILAPVLRRFLCSSYFCMLLSCMCCCELLLLLYLFAMIRTSVPLFMICLSGIYFECSVNLLEKDDSRQLVRECDLSEAHPEVGPFLDFIGQAQASSYYKTDSGIVK